MERNITYAPVILNSMVEIMACFNVGRETVLEWVDAGAPICVEYLVGKPRYSCEKARLQEWRLARSKK